MRSQLNDAAEDLSANLVKISTTIIRRAKELLEEECGRRRVATGGRVSEGVVMAEAILAYLGENPNHHKHKPRRRLQ